MEFLQNSLVELITQTATNLPPDVRAAMSAAGVHEKPDTQAVVYPSETASGSVIYPYAKARR